MIYPITLDRNIEQNKRRAMHKVQEATISDRCGGCNGEILCGTANENECAAPSDRLKSALYHAHVEGFGGQ